MGWRFGCLLALAIVADATPCTAEWTVNAQGSLFYTDDVGLFSATRRLDLHGRSHHTLAIDSALTGKRSDMLFEPDANVTKSFTSQLGRTDLSFRGQAFVYAVAPKFNNATSACRRYITLTRTRDFSCDITLHRIFS